jgi:hypothetical protein
LFIFVKNKPFAKAFIMRQLARWAAASLRCSGTSPKPWTARGPPSPRLAFMVSCQGINILGAALFNMFWTVELCFRGSFSSFYFVLASSLLSHSQGEYYFTGPPPATDAARSALVDALQV